jgi:hypothetical protein
MVVYHANLHYKEKQNSRGNFILFNLDQYGQDSYPVLNLPDLALKNSVCVLFPKVFLAEELRHFFSSGS